MGAVEVSRLRRGDRVMERDLAPKSPLNREVQVLQVGSYSSVSEVRYQVVGEHWQEHTGKCGADQEVEVLVRRPGG